MWAVSALSTDLIQISCLQRTWRNKIKVPFQLMYLSNAYEAYSRNIYISATVELTNAHPNLTLHEHFLGFNLTYMNILYYQFMQTLNTSELIPAQLKKHSHKLPNSTMVNYDLLKEQIQHIDENYPILCLPGLLFL